MAFYQDLEHKAYFHHTAYVDLSSIKEITPDAILYLLSLLEKIQKNRKISISGNAPQNVKCRKIFINSGFYDYVSSSYETLNNDKILTVKNANIVDSEIAADVVKFARKHLGIQRGITSRAFYTTILECMGNTKEHAYDSHEAQYAKWWLMSLYDEDDKIIRFAILDTGAGITNTVKKKYYEKAFGISDSTLIKSVLNGDFRTSTKLSYRGKGLPKIKSFKDRKLIQDLVVLSNNGYYYVDKDDSRTLQSKYNGSLICWSFLKGESHENKNI